MPDVEIHGHVDPKFEPVREALVENFRRRGEWGCSVCMWHEGRIVVDLWAGLRDVDKHEPFEANTLATAFSCTKGWVALCFLLQHQRRRLDYEAPVAEYWPEFAAGGKGSITVRTLLNHRAGLVGLDRDVTLDQIENHWDQVVRILEEQTPTWQPDTDQGYHAITYGLFGQELFKRVAGETIGSFLRREIAGPLGADVYIGLPEELEPRVSRNYPVTSAERVISVVPRALFSAGQEGRVFRDVLRGGDAARAFRYPSELGPRGVEAFDSRRVRRMELPWGNGVASARGICRLYSALANGGAIDDVHLVDSHRLEPIFERQSWVRCDRVLQKPQGWSQGFLKEQEHLFSPTPESFGHPGAGGALGWCDPIKKLAVGFVTSKMGFHVRSPRAIALCRAAYRCL